MTELQHEMEQQVQ